MRSLSVVAVTLALLSPQAGWTAISCPDRAPISVAAPAAASVKCQSTISKAGADFAKAKLKALGKCMAKQVPGLCPGVKETDKITKAAQKAAAKITLDCAADGVQNGLSSSYASLTDDAVITSCMLSQHNASGEILLGEINGSPGKVRDIKERDKCAKTVNGAGIKHATSVHKIINKCLATQMKLGTVGNLAPICIGSYSGGAFVAPTDAKAALALSTLETKTSAMIDKGCLPFPGYNYVPSLFACPGATTNDDLKTCLVCDGYDTVLDLVAQETSENAQYVPHAAGAIQAAVDSATAGQKLLIGSGTYNEQVTMATDGVQLVGCGGATGDRPNIERPSTGGPYFNGIFASGVDGLLFQSLDLTNWDDNGAFVTNADGVTFRDVHADGGLISTYGIFPVVSNNVVVEVSSARRVRDAGIYIGQSTNIVSRYNTATDNVAGMEIENSSNAFVHNNYLADNTGGLLVFKLPDPPIQVSDSHLVTENVSLHNNTPNFGIPGSTVAAVPQGTGLLIISNDDSEFTFNIVEDNDSIGLALVDQLVINFLVDPDPFPSPSPEQKAENNKIHDNHCAANGGSPHAPASGSVLLALGEDALPHGNCFYENFSPLQIVAGANDCP